MVSGNSTANFMKAKTHFFKNLNLSTILEPDAPDSAFTGCKVVATIGPSCQNVETLVDLLNAGVAGCRVDLTWGSLEFHRKSLQNLSEAMRQTRKLCCTMVDTLGREVMIRRAVKIDDQGWPVHESSIYIKAGQMVTLTTRSDVEASSSVLPLTYDRFNSMTEPGDTVYIGRYLVCGADQASLYLTVKEVQGTEILCEAKNDAELDGLLTVFHIERSNDTLLNVQNENPLLSPYDEECLIALGKEFEIDFVSLSYTRTREDVREARAFLDKVGMVNTKILAKVETRQSLLSFQGIVCEADAVIMSRGNLGLDCVPEKMALVQKTLVQICNMVGKPVLITRVVDTMVDTPRPTRAEATDVANAVLDGVDGILLGAETLRGKYPVETAKTICNICRQAERVFDHQHHYEHLMDAAMEDGIDALAGVIGSTAGNDSDDEGTTDRGVSDNEDRSVHFKEDGDVGPAMNLLLASNNNGSGNIQSLPGGLTRRHSAMHSSPSLATLGLSRLPSTPYLSKLESIASSAVRCADKVKAGLIVVYTHTGKTAALVAKYRPPMPILTLVVPHLVSDGLRWKLQGRANARQCLLSRGLLPMLAAPSPSGDALLNEAVGLAGRVGLVKPNDQIVCVQRVHDDFCVKILAVNTNGTGILRSLPSHGLGVAKGLESSFMGGAEPLSNRGSLDIRENSMGSPMMVGSLVSSSMVLPGNL